MIRTKTVHILGAGASADYGYPTGSDLQKRILENLGWPRSTAGPLTGVLNVSGFSGPLIEELRVGLIQTEYYSIDQLLEHTKDLVDIGKAAIAWSLIQYEDGDKLYNNAGWYKHAFNALER